MKTLPHVIFPVVFALSSSLNAQETGAIAVVDLIAVFKAHPKTVVAEAALAKQQKSSRDAFAAKKKELQNVLEKHQNVTQRLVTAGTSASSTDKNAAKELLEAATKLEKEIATLRTTQANDLKTNFVKERGVILAEIRETVAKFNQDGRYSMIFDTSAISANGIPQVIHSPGATDITVEILTLVKASKL